MSAIPSSSGFVRGEMIAPAPPPRLRASVLGWIGGRLFNSVGNAVLTVSGIIGLAALAWPTFRFLVLDAVWRGADRTGMAGVIVMLLQSDATLADARQQLGLRYGHVAVGKTRVLDRFFDLYEDWLGKQGRSHDKAAFRHWLLEEYSGGWCGTWFSSPSNNCSVCLPGGNSSRASVWPSPK